VTLKVQRKKFGSKAIHHPVGLKSFKTYFPLFVPFPSFYSFFFVAQKRSKKVADREMKLELFAM